MGWTTPIDIYCERTAVGLWNEPFNELSNIAFLLAAWWGYRTARDMGRLTFMNWVAIVLAGAIGIGSLLFHTFANAWSELADVIPIWTFVFWMILSIIVTMSDSNVWRALFGAVKVLAIVGLVFWFVSGALLDTPGAATAGSRLNSSEQHAPALLALIIFSLITGLRKHPASPWVATATGVFAISLALRTVDLALCSTFPVGTHFAWHLLNALMIGLLLQVLVRHIHAPTLR